MIRMNPIAISTPTPEAWTVVSESLGYLPWVYPSRWEDNKTATVIYASVRAYGSVTTARRKQYQIVDSTLWMSMTPYQRHIMLTETTEDMKQKSQSKRILKAANRLGISYDWAVTVLQGMIGGGLFILFLYLYQYTHG